MKWFISVIVATGLGVGLIALTHAQTIRPDTLADLKAEYEFQQKQAAPYLAEVEKTSQEYMECIDLLIKKPSETICVNKEKTMERAQINALVRLQTLVAAKEAYEREQRKANRKNPAKADKP